MAKNDFQYGRWNSYTMQCGTIMTLISSGDCTLQCDMWLWDYDIEFARWQHPAMWQVALGWHATEFPQTSYIRILHLVSISTNHRSRHVILHQSLKYDPNWTTLGRKKWRHVAFRESRSQPSSIEPSSIDTIALNCLVFEKIAFLHVGIKMQNGGSPPYWIFWIP